MTDFATLKTDVESWAARDDFPTSLYALGTERINRVLRVREMISSFSATTSSETVSLPSDYIEFDHLYIDKDPRVILSAGDSFEQTIAYRASGTPTQFFVAGSSLYLNPIPDGSYDLAGQYYAKLAQFSADADTNSVLTTYPEIYLAANLSVVFSWAQDMEQEAKWGAYFDGLVVQANQTDVMGRWSTPMRMRPRAYA